MRRALGIDVASAEWSANGSALIEIDPGSRAFTRVATGVIEWPAGPLTPAHLADAIDACARAGGIGAVGLDGPQGFRDPETPAGTPGVGRRCEYACKTQGKTGVHPVTYPGNQRAWMEFCVELFDELLAKPGVVLANAPASVPPDRGYLLLEVFPTSTWRKAGLTPLPGKGKHPGLKSFTAALSRAFQLPEFTPSTPKTHDDLQAVVAALPAAVLLGGSGVAIPSGVSATLGLDADGRSRRHEGYIWDATPPGGPFQAPRANRARGASQVAVRVTQGVIDDVNRGGPNRAMISVRGVEGATSAARRKLTLAIDDDEYTLVLGDTHAFHGIHQDDTTRQAFETLFALLAEQPQEYLDVRHVVDDVLE